MPSEEDLRIVAEALFKAIHPKGSKKVTWHDYVWLAKYVLEAKRGKAS